MFVCHVEYMKIASQQWAEYGSEQNYVFLLARSPMTFWQSGVTCALPAGQICLLTPGNVLRLKATETVGILDFFEFSLTEEETALVNSLPLRLNCLNAPPNCADLSSLIRGISIVFDSADKYRQEKMAGYFTILLYGIASGDDEPPTGSAEALQHYRLLNLRRKLSDDPAKQTTVAEAAKEVGLSVSRFEYLYKEQFGISYINDLIRLRIRRSCALLWTTDWTVAQVAAAMGYENESNFYRQFKQQVGISPREYRKMNKKIPE